jgi:hypothetical protein
MEKQTRKSNYKQMIWGLVLIGYGMYSVVQGIGFMEVSKLAMGNGLGQGSVFVIWGMREWIGYSIKQKEMKA